MLKPATDTRIDIKFTNVTGAATVITAIPPTGNVSGGKPDRSLSFRAFTVTVPVGKLPLVELEALIVCTLVIPGEPVKMVCSPTPSSEVEERPSAGKYVPLAVIAPVFHTNV